jgi:hypothetical protein
VPYCFFFGLYIVCENSLSIYFFAKLLIAHRNAQGYTSALKLNDKKGSRPCTNPLLLNGRWLKIIGEPEAEINPQGSGE